MTRPADPAVRHRLVAFAEHVTVDAVLTAAVAAADPHPGLWRGEFHRTRPLWVPGTAVDFGPARSFTDDDHIADWYAIAAWMGTGCPVRFRITGMPALPVPADAVAHMAGEHEWVGGGQVTIISVTARAFPHPDGHDDTIAGLAVTGRWTSR